MPLETWTLGYLLLVVGGILGIVGLFMGDDGKEHLVVTDEGWGRPGFVFVTVGGVLRVAGFFLFGAGVLIILFMVTTGP